MAYVTGTSTGVNDMLDQLKTFLTTSADLPAVQRWTVLDDRVESGDRVIYLRGPGTTGVDLIYVNVRAHIDVLAPSIYLEWRGATGFVTEVSFEGQPGGTSLSAFTPMNDSGNSYWFFANGRRFILCVLLSGSVLMSVYMGFFLPYALPTEYPYPMLIMANTHRSTFAWDTSTSLVNSFFRMGTGDDAPLEGAGYMRDPGGTWIPCMRRDIISTPVVHTWPYHDDLHLRSQSAYGNFEALIAIMLYNFGLGGGVYGELDGVFFVSGDQISFLDTVTVGSDVYLIMNGPHSSGRNETAAIFRG